MKFSVSSSVLSSRLQTLSRVVNAKSPLNILECFLFEVSGNNLYIKASDSETMVETSLEVIDSQSEGKIAVVAKTLLETLRELPEQPITFSADTKTFEVTILYQNGKCNLIGRNGDEYPAWAKMSDNTVKIDFQAEALLNGINNTLFATADDELRPVMNGVYFDITTEGITFVSSDSHKLVRYQNLEVKGSDRSAFILPKKPSNLLKLLLAKEQDKVSVTFDEHYAEFVLENYKLTCRLIEGRYPNYNAVIPQNNIYKATIDRVSLLSALRRVSVFSSQASNLIKLSLGNGSIMVSAQDIDFSTSAEEKVACQYDGVEMNIGFKSTLLIDILTNLQTTDVILELSDPSRAGLVVPSEQEENQDLLMLLMPMMLND